MFNLLSHEIASNLMMTLAFADGARTALPLLLLSVPAVILLVGMVSEKASSSERGAG
ncbi:hypothetical protein [Planctomicrobium piriforme]|uniref:Uncharacterized protein n=1 Tax=Planctomicrobium piriforme TaxID=1576369 RepID=A0A1I3LST7_9PLAN|nr:hypothetical protein [Planctomicrobium piriforme]SFI87516.1 hypothetical protein SAMN05421753_11349 [Planctomicrobium piriforme]